MIGAAAWLLIFAAAAFGALIGYAGLVFALLLLGVLIFAGIIAWYVMSPARTRAHVKYRRRIANRPRPASEWDKPDELPPLIEPRPRADIVARPGRRMVALLDPDEQTVSR